MFDIGGRVEEAPHILGIPETHETIWNSNPLADPYQTLAPSTSLRLMVGGAQVGISTFSFVFYGKSKTIMLPMWV